LFPLDRLLHSDFAKLTEDYQRACSDRESCRQEVENLKLQLQTYVSEVKRAEEMLARKVCRMCEGTIAAFFVPPFYFFNVLDSNKKKGSCAVVSVTSLYVWMFALNYHSLCNFFFFFFLII